MRKRSGRSASVGRCIICAMPPAPTTATRRGCLSSGTSSSSTISQPAWRFDPRPSLDSRIARILTYLPWNVPSQEAVDGGIGDEARPLSSGNLRPAGRRSSAAPSRRPSGWGCVWWCSPPSARSTWRSRCRSWRSWSRRVSPRSASPRRARRGSCPPWPRPTPLASRSWSSTTRWTRPRRPVQAHPEIDSVFACNDMMALGAIEAIAAAGRTGTIRVIGFDAVADARQAIETGAIGLVTRASR